MSERKAQRRLTAYYVTKVRSKHRPSSASRGPQSETSAISAVDIVKNPCDRGIVKIIYIYIYIHIDVRVHA